MDEKATYPFSLEEWETCIRVLENLKHDPLNNPDNEHFKSLIAKIKKNAGKKIRAESYKQKKAEDLTVQKATVIVNNALQGQSEYASFPTEVPENEQYKQLNIPKICYCCNQSFTSVHFFYNRICPKCAEQNYKKRFQSGDLSNHTALLTGCRVKVGYATSLKLLRSGAFLIGTSRFPALALDQFRKEDDFDQWKDRLVIYGLDLRDLKQIDTFLEYVKTTVKQLHILINNAAQTIRYPDNYYLPLVANEKKLLNNFKNIQLIANTTPVISTVQLPETEKLSLPEPAAVSRFGQPVDRRNKTSWNSTLEDIGLTELLEVNLINQIAPYYLIKGLKPLMVKANEKPCHIINVTSSEGIFSYTNKTIHHPHTNMTKASLNMLSRTSAAGFASDNIYMNSVDVGWISTGATEKLRKKQFEKAYVPPLDSVDGAGRILDPIFNGLRGELIFGKLLKNYTLHEW